MPMRLPVRISESLSGEARRMMKITTERLDQGTAQRRWVITSGFGLTALNTGVLKARIMWAAKLGELGGNSSIGGKPLPFLR